MGYRRLIRESMLMIGRVGESEPRLVEAWMRSAHDTLDSLSEREFRAEVATALDCIAESNIEMSEQLANSMGL